MIEPCWRWNSPWWSPTSSAVCWHEQKLFWEVPKRGVIFYIASSSSVPKSSPNPSVFIAPQYHCSLNVGKNNPHSHPHQINTWISACTFNLGAHQPLLLKLFIILPDYLKPWGNTHVSKIYISHSALCQSPSCPLPPEATSMGHTASLPPIPQWHVLSCIGAWELLHQFARAAITEFYRSPRWRYYSIDFSWTSLLDM